jgi:MFS family permease
MRAKIEEIFGPVADGGVYGLSKEVIGWAFSPAFWGFTIAMVIGGFILDIVKTRTIVWAAFFLQLIGSVFFVLAHDKETLFIANVFIGLGNGSVEASLNPLIATIYPRDKSKMLNRFHVWFPGGIVIGSLLAFFLMDKLEVTWQVYVGLLFIPLAIYGFLFLGQKIPETERVTSGVTYKGMLNAIGAPVSIITTMVIMFLLAVNIIALPQGWMYIGIVGLAAIVSVIEALFIRKAKVIFPVIFSFMLLTSATELVTNQWLNALLGNKGVSPMLILALISGIMAVGRFFAGKLIHRIHPTGVLLFSAILSALGIYTLSIVDSTAMTFVGAIIFAIGVTYFWPTMLGFTSEYNPRSGAMGLSLLGGAGFVSTAMFLPVMGRVMETSGTDVALQSIGLLPVILIVGFSVLFSVYRKKKPVHLQ